MKQLKLFSLFSIIFLCIQCASINLKGKLHHPRTKDGWPLTLERFKPLSSNTRRYPILFCHGFMANRKEFTIAEKRSLVYDLQKEGYEVWIMDLRGRDDAGSPGLFFGEHTYDYNVDQYAQYDLDKAIEFVLTQTGNTRLNMIGHSMGGMIPYIRLGSMQENRIANLVTIASPGMLTPANRSITFLYKMKGGMAVMPVLPVATLSHMAGFFHISPVPKEVALTLYNPRNVSSSDENKLLRLAVNNVAKPEMQQFIVTLETGELYSADKKVNYTKNLVNIRTPALLVAGRKDNFVTVANVRYVYDQISSKDKTMLTIGRATGASADYGHTDLVLGKKIHKDVNPQILKWLNARN